MKGWFANPATFLVAAGRRIGVSAAGKTKTNEQKRSLLRAKALRRRREEAPPKLTLNPEFIEPMTYNKLPTPSPATLDTLHRG
jgi:hypothetical protein